MQYIYEDTDGWVHFDPYFAYLGAIQEDLPPNARRFALKREHYIFSDPETLHDAWLESFIIRELSTGKRSEIRTLQLELCLFGPYHDRRIWLTYQHVSSYHLHAPPAAEQPLLDWQGRTIGAISLTHESGHGDLFVHEVRLADTGKVVHELHFTHGSTFIVECGDIMHREERFGT